MILKSVLKKIGFEIVDWAYLTQERVQSVKLLWTQ